MKKKGVLGYLTPYKDMPKQLCTPQEFREKICGQGAGYADLVRKNVDGSGLPLKHGVPQGAPLSDLMANLYLIDFDTAMADLIAKKGGCYMRYSDDILIILPGTRTDALAVKQHAQDRIVAYGKNLQIKESKCSVHRFRKSKGRLIHTHVLPTDRRSNGLSYLGFRFDGRCVYLKDGTVANFWRKASSRLRQKAANLVKRYPGKDLAFLRSLYNVDRIIEKVGRARDFEPTNDKKKWTFWTYVKRANDVFGEQSRIHHQMRNYRQKIREKGEIRLAKTYYKSL